MRRLRGGTYKTGGIYDLPFSGAAAWIFLGGHLRDGVPARTDRRCSATAQPAGRSLLYLAKLALLSLPVMGYWALFLSQR